MKWKIQKFEFYCDLVVVFKHNRVPVVVDTRTCTNFAFLSLDHQPIRTPLCVEFFFQVFTTFLTLFPFFLLCRLEPIRALKLICLSRPFFLRIERALVPSSTSTKVTYTSRYSFKQTGFVCFPSNTILIVCLLNKVNVFLASLSQFACFLIKRFQHYFLLLSVPHRTSHNKIPVGIPQTIDQIVFPLLLSLLYC